MEIIEYKIKEEFVGDYYMKKKKVSVGFFGLFGLVVVVLLYFVYFGGFLVI